MIIENSTCTLTAAHYVSGNEAKCPKEAAGQDSAEEKSISHSDNPGEQGQSDDSQDIPECWTSNMFREKIKQCLWLICQSNKLGCLTCQ